MQYIVDTKDGRKYVVVTDNVDEAFMMVLNIRNGSTVDTTLFESRDAMDIATVGWDWEMAENGVMVIDSTLTII